METVVEAITDIVVGVITKVAKYMFSPFMDRASYLLHYKTNANDLRKQMASLGELKADVQRSVDVARLRGDVIKVVVESWLSKVNQIESEEKTLHNELEGSKGCLQRGCSLRYRVGKDAKRMIDDVNQLLNEGRSFSVVSDPSPLPPGLESMQTLDFHIYDSTKLATDKIVEALKDEGVRMVGVYGIGGVGKTTLMKEVAKNMKKDGLFDQVVMVTVSQEPVLKKIQGKIGENLGLTLSEESLDVRARRLLKRLKEEKRILIVLDDLWKPLNLPEELGIPCESSCKVVLTTRQLQVCRQMETQSNVELKVLSEGDAWALFKWAAGDCLAGNNVALCEVANQVVRECGGLPLAIITIGRALRAKDLYVWKDVASQLKMSSSSPPDIEGVHEKVFHSIKLSFDFLESKATKFCFLLCCMFPEDFPISEDDLLPYVVGEGVFGDIDTLREARDRLHMQMDRLKVSCLLLDDSERMEGCVRMHDVIRDVSIWIASKEGHDFVVKSGRGLTHFPEEDRDKNLRKCKRLSLMENEITKLPSRLEYCSDQLMTLSLRDNDYLWEIPDGFFHGMISLKTLDLVNTNFSSIPSSLSCLTDLRVLCVSTDYLNFQDHEPFDMSLVGKLKKLEILQVRSVDVIKLSEEIGKLTNLKLLDLSGNWSMSIAPNILSRLSLLEELNLEESFHEWEIEGGGSKKEEEDDVGILSKKACCCLSEVTSLSSLTRLRIKVSNIKCLGSANNIPFRSWENLTYFSIILGNLDWFSMNDGVKACATGVVICGAIIPNNNPLLLLERAEGLQLNASPGDAVSGLGAKVLNNLRVLCVEKCDDMEYLLNTTIPQITFSSLEKLYLISLHKLKAIIMCNHGSSLPSGCFNYLRILKLFGCNGLISIIPSDLLAKLPNLEDLHVRYCDGATEVFNSKGLQLLLDDEGQAEATVLPKLKQLELSSLPSLRTIWDEGVVSPNLSLLLNLEEITVNHLRLKFIFSLDMVQRLQQLERLQIQSCQVLVEIISLMEGDDTQRISSTSSSRLLQLNNNNPSSSSSSVILPTPPIFGNLRHLYIFDCNSLTHILPMSLAQGLQQLKELIIRYCYNLVEIIQNDHDDIDAEKEEAIIMRKKKTTLLFPSLETLEVQLCPKLKRLTPVISTATKLREIEVEEEWFNALEWDDQNDKLHLQERVEVIFI